MNEDERAKLYEISVEEMKILEPPIKKYRGGEFDG